MVSKDLPSSGAWQRTAVIFLFDVVLAAISFPIALYLRLGSDLFEYDWDLVVTSTSIFTLVAAIVIFQSKLHRVPWRYISVDDAMLLGRTALIINITFLVVMFLTVRLDGIPRSSVVIDTMVLTALLVGARLSVRLWYEKQIGLLRISGDLANVQSVLLIGATDEAEAFIRKMARDPNARYRVLGIVETGSRPVGSRIRGVKIVGDVDKLPDIILTYRSILSSLVLADPDMRGEPVRDLLETARGHNLKLDRLPQMSLLTKASAQEIDIRPVDVEDLLSRPQAELDRDAMADLIGNKRVLVTGAGGSIGSELVRQVASFSPAHLTLFDNSEFNLYEIDRQLGEQHSRLSRSAIIGNVRDQAHVERVFSQEQPEIVFHAAALKHVPMLEPQPSQAVLTNVLGTKNIADATVRHGIDTMVMISTDKATHPVNAMGASKRIAETYCQSLDIDARRSNQTRFVTVRFGNVLGSAGSVIPLFEKQLRQGGPITVTHEEMTRYFMTIREAVELVLQAATLRDDTIDQGGAILVLDMGKPVKILDMANEMIKLAGLTPHEDIEIKITGLRPGERLYEDLFDDAEELLPTSHAAMMAARPRVADRAFVEKGISAMVQAAGEGDDPAVRELMGRLIPDFTSADVKVGQKPSSAQSPSATE
ncbi:nucleoside-diphosphate sugar epimerase/dehydratase [Parvibaculaceae bacterium PLY_AMNH_Bact1]|nr:nucleoside-diphosphate sugar epimerase/dehydratase [Parvibaculaceae bacterium PLY_AMNH_Bact1]